MPGLLTRSKSLRFLKGARKDTYNQGNEDFMPPPNGSQTIFDRYRPMTPISKTEGKSGGQDLAVRPSTSGGPGDHATMFHKKTYPAPSIYSQDHVLALPTPTESTTVLYTAELTEEQGIIGIALGSPTIGSHWNQIPQAANFSTAPQATDAHMAPFTYYDGSSPLPQEPIKSKLSRWKSLFRKAAPPPPEKPSFYQLAQNVTAAPRADSHHDEESVDSQIRSIQEKERLSKVSPSTYKPDIRASRSIAPRSPPDVLSGRARAQTLGDPTSDSRRPTTMLRAVTAPIPPPKHMAESSPIMPQVVFSKATSDASPPASGRIDSEETRLLDVSIPDVTMERYSVMFGNLLQPGSNRSSSLLARRQANAEKLKPLNALSVKEEEQENPMINKRQRCATSPIMSSPSPRLSLFPSTNPRRSPSPLSISSSTPRTKTLQRSRTAPAKSPLRQTFLQATEGITKIPVSATLKPASSPHLKPALTPTSIHSFESDADSITIVMANTTPGRSKPFRVPLDEREPEWEICSKPRPVVLPKSKAAAEVVAVAPTTSTTTTLARTDSQRQPRVTKLSALSSHPSSAPLDTPSPLQRIQSLASPPLSAGHSGRRAASENRGQKRDAAAEPSATVGVARSISVSKANSPRALIRTMTDIGSVGSPERLVAGQALTPTMVEVKNRRSQRVQLEMAV